MDTFSEDNYKKLGGKNWENFYILRTAGESIIKFIDGSLDDIGKYKLVGIRNVDEDICDINFSLELKFDFEEKSYRVLAGGNLELFYSICF